MSKIIIRKSQFILIFCILNMLINGCSIFLKNKREKTFKEKVQDEIFYIATDKQKKELNELNSPDEINIFLEKFWKELDPNQETEINELKEVYLERYNYANEHFQECGREGWETDMGRVYILYGPPDEIIQEVLPQNLERNDASNIFIHNLIYSHVMVKSIQIWLYNRPATDRKKANIFSQYYPNLTKFIFTDLDGFGGFDQIFSTEKGEIDDPRVFIK